MFQDFNTPGVVNSQALDMNQAEELAKTLQAGHGYLGSPTSLVGGAALQVESLDSTLKSVTYDASNLVLWPSIPQDRAYALVEQYVRTNSYGDGGSPFVPESGSPAMNDSEYNRHARKVVFLSTRRGVSLASTLVKSFAGDAESRESQAGTLWMLERLERELYKGNSDFSNGGYFDGAVSAIPSKMQNLNLDGLELQLRQGDQDYTAQSRAFEGYGAAQSIVKDMGGDIIEEGTIEDLANVLLENFGRPAELHLAPKQMSDFIKQFYPKERVNVLGIADGKAGYVVREMVTTAGSIALKPNVFLKPKEGAKAQSDRAGVPQAPASASAAEATDGDSKLQSGEVYQYSVSSINEQGECASVAETSAVTVSADGKVIRVTISAPSSGVAPSHYAVYRSDKNGAGRKFVGYVKAAGSSTQFTDRGEKVEGSATAYMLDMRPEIMVWKQLAPLMKLNLAQVSTAKEFLLWLAGTMIVFAPRKSGIIQNIGKA